MAVLDKFEKINVFILFLYLPSFVIFFHIYTGLN